MNLKPKGRNDSHKFDYSKITDKIYIGSDMCKGGVCMIHGEEFKKLGVSVEINLSIESNELPPKEISSYVWLPTVDGYAPSNIQLGIGTSVINEAVESDDTVYVHCRNGHGRSPTLVAAYFVRYKNISVDDAIELIGKKRSEVHVEDRQRKALMKFREMIE
jgi:protein-tyrosine phosphatase